MPERVIPAYNLPKGRAVDGAKVVEAAEVAEAAEAPQAAQAAQAPEGRMVCRETDDLLSVFSSGIGLAQAVAGSSFSRS